MVTISGCPKKGPENNEKSDWIIATTSFSLVLLLDLTTVLERFTIQR